MSIEPVRFAGIDGGGLRLGDGRRNEGVLDGVGVDAVGARKDRLPAGRRSPAALRGQFERPRCALGWWIFRP